MFEQEDYTKFTKVELDKYIQYYQKALQNISTEIGDLEGEKRSTRSTLDDLLAERIRRHKNALQ